MEKEKKYLSEEHKKKIGLANAKRMKEFWKEGRATDKQKSIFTSEYQKGKKMSEKSKENLRKIHKEMWANGQITDEQKKIFLAQRGMMKGKKQSDKQKEIFSRIMKEVRKTQVFPKKDSSIEVKIQDFLTKLNIHFLKHQYMEIEHGYQCDFLIPDYNLVIECDGDYWHGNRKVFPNPNEWQLKQIEEDKIRTKELEEQGFRVLRLWECDIKVMQLNEFEEILKGVN